MILWKYKWHHVTLAQNSPKASCKSETESQPLQWPTEPWRSNRLLSPPWPHLLLLPPLLPLLSIWPSHSSSSIPGMFPLQGLWACSFTYLECSVPRSRSSSLPTSFRFVLCVTCSASKMENYLIQTSLATLSKMKTTPQLLPCFIFLLITYH